MSEDEKKEFQQIWNDCKWGGCMTPTLAFILVILLLCGCKTKKVIEKESVQDSVKTEYIEKIVEVPVKVYIEVPAESKEITTNDTTSTLKTQFATSTASLIWKGFEPLLFHSLENIPQKIEKADTVAVKEIVRTEYKTKKIYYTKTIKEGQKWWQKGLQFVGLLSLIGLLIYLSGFILRR